MKTVFICLFCLISILDLTAKEFYICKKSEVNEEIDLLKLAAKSFEDFIIIDIALDNAPDGYAKIIYDYKIPSYFH